MLSSLDFHHKIQDCKQWYRGSGFICFVHIWKEKLKHFKDYNYTEEMAFNRKEEKKETHELLHETKRVWEVHTVCLMHLASRIIPGI